MHGATQKKEGWIGLLFKVQKVNNNNLQDAETSDKEEDKKKLEFMRLHGEDCKSNQSHI